MKSIVFSICLVIMLSLFWNCGGESTLSKSQITQNMLDTLEESLDGTVTVEAYCGAFTNKGTYQEIVAFHAAVGIGSPGENTFWVIADLDEIKTTHKYRITGTVSKEKEISIDGLTLDVGREEFVIEATDLELLGKNSDFVSYSP